VVAHAFNLSTWEAEAGEIEFEASLVYRVSSRTVRTIQSNPVSKKKKKTRLRVVKSRCSRGGIPGVSPRCLAQ
jgi:hypothetical protein